MNNNQVVEKFLNHQSANSENLHSDGCSLKSYDFIIAQWKDETDLRPAELYVVSGKMQSVTTTRHRNKLLGTAMAKDIVLVES